MIIVYWIVLIAFIITMIFLLHSIAVKYNNKYILTKASEKISDGYLIFTPNGKITNFNKSFLKSFHFKKNELKNKNVYEVFKKKKFDATDVNKLISACKEVRSSNNSIKFDIKEQINDRIFKIEIKSLINNDIFLRYVMICKDVTNTYEIIEKLHDNQDIMANREKFATLGQLISRNCTFLKIPNFCFIWRIRRIK